MRENLISFTMTLPTCDVCGASTVGFHREKSKGDRIEDKITFACGASFNRDTCQKILHASGDGNYPDGSFALDQSMMDVWEQERSCGHAARVARESIAALARISAKATADARRENQ